MRHIRTRRRFQVALTMLLVVCAMLFVETRIEAFAPQVKEYVELRAGQALGGKVKLSIGSIEGGILHPISFNEVALKDTKDAAILTSVVIDSIRTNYHVWDLFARRGAGSAGSSAASLLSRDGYAYVTFETKNREHAGFVRVEGDLTDAKVKGFVTLFARQKVEFEGRITSAYFALELRPPFGVIRIYGRVTPSGEIVMSVRASRLHVGGATAEADIMTRTRIEPDAGAPGQKMVSGEFETRRLVVNGKQMPGVRAEYRLAKGVLAIKRLEIAERLTIAGEVFLREPCTVKLTATLDAMSVNKICALLGATDISKHISGTVSARSEISGLAADPKSVTRLEARHGAIWTFEFASLSATLKGDGPLLRIEEARIVRDSGTLEIEGEFDLRRFGTGNAFDHVRLAGSDRAITWDVFSSVRRDGNEEVTMSKKLTGDVNVGYKKYVTDSRIDESCRDKDEITLEYRLSEGGALAVGAKDGSGFLGVQHRDKF